MSLIIHKDPYGTGDSPDQYEWTEGEDLCMNCGKQHEISDYEIIPEVEIGIGHFCSNKCAAQYAFDQLTWEEDKKEARRLSYALSLILNNPAKELISQLDEEDTATALHNIAGSLSETFADDDIPAWAEEDMVLVPRKALGDAKRSLQATLNIYQAQIEEHRAKSKEREEYAAFARIREADAHDLHEVIKGLEEL